MKPQNPFFRAIKIMLWLGGASVVMQGNAEPDVAAEQLKPVSAFANMADKNERSRALFLEMGKVIQHPRCVNCHPVGESPTQGLDMHLHEPPVSRGNGGFGQVGMECNTCHRAANYPLAGHAENVNSIPGNPLWHLAPAEMAWAGKSLGAICEQIKDKKRNGDKSLEELKHHMAEDTLVGWGWNPGAGRQPVPGTQQQFGELFNAWVASGALCPEQ